VESSVRCLAAGDRAARNDLASALDELAVLYPQHIEKEDGHFFWPTSVYFTDDEQAKMLEEFGEINRRASHERYEALVKRLEQSVGKKKA
jgi:hemerythrin-like domain-containing protein